MALLEVKNLGITFGGLHAVDHFNLQVEQGELYGLIGPNGAGKTTVFNLLTGVYQPTTGSFFLDGENLTGKAPIEINKKGIARTFQNIRLFQNMSVIENVKVGLHNSGHCSFLESVLRLPRYFKEEAALDEKAMELLSVFGLDGERDYLASGLPYGKQRKLEIARALATDPKLLLLDEPAAGMNPGETAELMDTIRFVREHFAMTILLIEHDMKLVAGICEKVSVLNFGQELAHGQHLLLAARECSGNLRAALLEPREAGIDHFQRILDFLFILAGERAQPQVFQHAQLLKNPPPFGHVRHAQRDDFMRRGFEQVCAIKADAAAARGDETGDGLQNRRLAGTVCANQRHNLSLANLERDALHRGDDAIGYT